MMRCFIVEIEMEDVGTPFDGLTKGVQLTINKKPMTSRYGHETLNIFVIAMCESMTPICGCNSSWARGKWRCSTGRFVSRIPGERLHCEMSCEEKNNNPRQKGLLEAMLVVFIFPH